MATKQDRSGYLLLLPPPPHPATWDALSAAYRPPLAAVLRNLSSEIRKTDQGAVLDIALPIPHLLQRQRSPRASLYRETQTLVSGLYKLVCVIAAADQINVEDHEGVDVRVLMLAYEQGHDEKLASTSRLDTVVSLQTLATSQRSWDCVIAVESEEGEEILRRFSAYLDRRPRLNRVAGGTVLVSRGSKQDQEDESPANKHHYKSVVVGGTFDHIHIGHKLLLTMFAFVLAGEDPGAEVKRTLTIGITGDELLKEKKYPELLESWDQRQSVTLNFLRAILDFTPDGDGHVKAIHVSEPGPNGHAVNVWLGANLVLKCVEIWDPFGPTITDEDISAMVLSAETRSGGKAVNDKRREKGWVELEVFEVDVLDAEESTQDQQQDEKFQAKLSSTTIRKALSEKAQMRSKV